MTREIKIGDVTIGGEHPIVLIAGPCVIESEKSALWHAKEIKRISDMLDIPVIFKSSYDKANRTSISAFRGIGASRGLAILKRIKEEFGMPVLSDIHCKTEMDEARKVLDVIQIPAFLSRQTDLIVAAVKTGKVVNIKKGQFMAPWDFKNIIAKVEKSGGKKLLITERGSSFGYNNLVSDMRSLQILKEFGYPVIYDATHSAQLPGGLGVSSGGQRQFVAGLARAAVAVGCDGLFIEVHENPDKAPCDGPNMIFLKDLEDLLMQVKEIDSLVKTII